MLVDRYRRLVLIRSSPDVVPTPDQAAEIAGRLAKDTWARGLATLVVGVDGPPSPELWTSLGQQIDRWQLERVTGLLLVLSGAGHGPGKLPALAQRIAEARLIDVIAPLADAVIVPGGSLFACSPDGRPQGGWQLFRAKAQPDPMGQRIPVPSWQAAASGVLHRTPSGWLIDQIPAGLLLRPPEARAPEIGDLCFQVPVDPTCLTVVLGVPGPQGGADVLPADLAAVVAALPPEIQPGVRFAPGNDRDPLTAVQQAAGLLGLKLELLTGLPLVAVGDAGPDGTAHPVGGETVPFLVSQAGEPTWSPPVEAVRCGKDGPQLLRWRASALDDLRSLYERGAEDGSITVGRDWQIAVTRAGFALTPAGRPVAVDNRPVAADELAIDVHLPEEPLEQMEESLAGALSALLDSIGPVQCGLVTMYLLNGSPAQVSWLGQLAAPYDLRPPVPVLGAAQDSVLAEVSAMPDPHDVAEAGGAAGGRAGRARQLY